MADDGRAQLRRQKTGWRDCSYLVSGSRAQALIIGDAVNLPGAAHGQFEWVPPVDMDPATAVATRWVLLERAATEHVPAVGYQPLGV